MIPPNNANRIADSEDLDEQFDLDLHCLPKPVCRRIKDHYCIIYILFVSILVRLKFCHSLTETLIQCDVAVIQWITSCHKYCYDNTCINTLDGNK